MELLNWSLWCLYSWWVGALWTVTENFKISSDFKNSKPNVFQDILSSFDFWTSPQPPPPPTPPILYQICFSSDLVYTFLDFPLNPLTALAFFFQMTCQHITHIYMHSAKKAFSSLRIYICTLFIILCFHGSTASSMWYFNEMCSLGPWGWGRV